MTPDAFRTKYGPWALVAGASEGLGAAFASELSRRGLGVILVARRADALSTVASRMTTPTVTVVADLSTVEGVARAVDAAAERDVGLVVANAALSPIGRFVDQPPDELERALALNCGAPMRLARHLLPAMVRRGRGGFVVMSSLAGQQGSPPISLYAATKAFGAILAEGLWAELRGSGVDVVTCVAGAVSTPGLANAKAKPAPGTRTPDQVVAAALAGLGHGPRVVPGALMRVSSALMTRVMPRRAAISIIARASRDLS
ncbi:MAG: SDR family NAD(P)-dependent oxidoreductase [Betaproteobacteria bacterium]